MSSEGTPQHGDRSAWNVMDFDTEHAKDIMDSTLRRHLPLPGADGGYARSDGTDWQRVSSIALGDIADIATTYLKLDASNDPITAGLEINAATADESVLTLQTTDDDATNHIQEWQDSNGAVLASIGSGGALSLPIETVTGTSDTLDDTNHVVLVDDDTAGSTVTITLPTVSGNTGLIYHIKKLGTTANVIVDGASSEQIDGATTATLTAQYESITIICNGSFWSII